jgi:endoglucanase
VRSYLALIGLEFYGYKGNPADPAFNGSPRSGLRYVGTGGDFLIEDSKFVYTDFIVQTYGTGVYKNVEIRRNIVVDAYHVGTCGQNSAYRPSGIYTSHVNGLVFEGNFYDHNGWNESVPTACATMYNHNFYVNGNDMVLKDNLITRGSSMAIKTVADGVGDVNRMIIDNNFMYDGEIGISAGGNATGNYRYVDTVIKNNVFSEIGKSNNTNRSFSWGLDIQDHDRSLVENNYFLNQPWYTNSYGIEISSPSLRDVTIRSNTFYNINGNALAVSPKALWSNIKVTGNTFAAPVAGACLVKHSGSFTTVAYSNNQYSSNALCVDSARQTLAQWKVSSGETTASQFVGAFSDPTRTLATYASSKGYSSVDAFLKAAQSQSRFAWNNDFTAKTINEYIKSGFVVSGNATVIENLSPVNGSCGDVVKQSQVYVPATWLCASGTASSVSSSASGYSWSCSALNGGVSASCSAGKLVTSSTTGSFWTFVVKENNSFTLVGTQTVRYGSGSAWIEKSLSGKVDCTNAFFGKDPLVGIPKQCDVLSPTGGVTGVVASLTSVASNPLVLGASTLRYTWNHDLQIGKDYPEDIKALQTVLREEGLYTGEITGGYYAETYKAVKLFQEKNGIKGTGYVGQITRNLLNSLYGN